MAFWKIADKFREELTCLLTSVHLLFRWSKATATGALVSGSCRTLPASALGSEAISSRMEPSLALSFANLAVSEPTEVCKFIRDCYVTFDDVTCACFVFFRSEQAASALGRTKQTPGLRSQGWEVYADLDALLQSLWLLERWSPLDKQLQSRGPLIAASRVLPRPASMAPVGQLAARLTQELA